MQAIAVNSFIAGKWQPPQGELRRVASAIDGAHVASVSAAPLPAEAMIAHALDIGGPALWDLDFQRRAGMLKALASYLGERKQALYELSYQTGATKTDSMIDIDGGIGTLFVFASKGRRELPASNILIDGETEFLSKGGEFAGIHALTPMQGVALHINAFNFPVWGMLEKLAPALLAGVPAIIKPATDTAYVAEACFRMMIESGLLPQGAVQLACGNVTSILERLGGQDSVGFTGSAATANRLKSMPNLLSGSVRFMAEQDSLNASILGLDATPGTPEFDLFVKEVVREMTAKAGQKCTAIRRILAPQNYVGDVIEAVSARLEKTLIGDPRLENVRMGALVSLSQRADVLDKAAIIGTEARRVFGNPDGFHVEGADATSGAFLTPMLFHCEDPDAATRIHQTEAFGPVSTIMGYRDLGHAFALANRGGGALVLSVITHDPAVALQAVQQSGSHHGRIYINDRDSMKGATGHGSPMPHLVHGGPGRAGGGEELGGLRGVAHYLQRTAVQGSPAILSAVTGEWIKGAPRPETPTHPFTKKFGELQLGETLRTAARDITLEDIEHFAHFTGDTFYAHMDEEAARANPFFPGRVAHGYLLLSFAAGLFVQPDPGPVLANTGLTGLRFLKPVSPGDSITVALTVKKKSRRTDSYGEVRWHVSLTNQNSEEVAEYELHTMNAY